MQAAPSPIVPPRKSYFERFKKLNSSTFKGGPDPLTTEIWIWEIEKLFNALQHLNDVKIRMAISMLKGNAKFRQTVMKVAQGDEDDLMI